MTALAPLDVLYDVSQGVEVPLPPALADVYGALRMPAPAGRPHIITNFVQSIDGVVTLDTEHSAGGPISGRNQHDRLVMAMLRSIADAVITGAGTLRSVPRHVWTADHVLPDLATEFQDLRARLGKPKYPLNVIVTASGELDAESAVLNQPDVPVLIVTTDAGAKRLPPTRAKVRAVSASGGLDMCAVVDAVVEETTGGLLLLEVGPTLLGRFLAERLADELFLTVAPQIAGRDVAEKRPGLVAGRELAPDDPQWGTLVSVRRGESYLFFRYALKDDAGGS